ncbi:MAG TPA: MFS transporter [Solirubrobacteraceae bacterium]|nr:MFS transporter [Solirubrobacteraceae bacterium]
MAAEQPVPAAAAASIEQGAAAHGASNRWLVLVIVCMAQFMVVLDATVVNVALPSIQRGLHFSQANLQWVVNAYTLVFGGFLLLGGRAADLLGRKRLFMVGVLVFSGASMLNGLAQTSGMLVAGRALQGLGGAIVSPAALAIITTTFPDSAERTKALGVWSAIAAGGAAFGLLLGGVLTDLLSWQWVFFVNLPVGVASFAAALRLVPESRAELQHRSFDLAGAITVTGGLLVLVYAIVEAKTYGWGSARIVGLGSLGVALLAAFAAIESRSRMPLMRLSIFRLRSLAVADGALLLVASAMFSMFFFASLYVQDIQGYSPLRAGLAFLPVSAGIMIGAGAAQQLIRRLGVRGVSVLGLALATAGMAWLVRLPVHGSYLGDLLAGLLPLAIGMGLVFVPITLLATSGVEHEDAGLASGLFNTAQQVGGALGLAILSTVAADHTSALLRGAGHASAAGAEVAGFHVAFLGGTVMLALGALFISVLLRRRHVLHVDVGAPLTVAA